MNKINITAASVLEVSNAILGKGPKVSKETYKAHVPAFVSKSGFINPDWLEQHGSQFQRAAFEANPIEISYEPPYSDEFLAGVAANDLELVKSFTGNLHAPEHSPQSDGTSFEEPLLFRAINHGAIDIVLHLLPSANLLAVQNDRYDQAVTFHLLASAVESGSLPIVQALLENGALPTINSIFKKYYGTAPIDRASEEIQALLRPYVGQVIADPSILKFPVSTHLGVRHHFEVEMDVGMQSPKLCWEMTSWFEKCETTA